jgi:hypothetical protein
LEVRCKRPTKRRRPSKILIFGGTSKFPKLIVFGQILANFGSFGQNLLHCSG